METSFDIARTLQGCLNGDARCQHALYQHYSARYYALCCRYLQDPQLAGDALMEGFLSVFNNLSRYRQDGPLEAWMRRIFVRQCLKQLRLRQHSPLLPLAPDLVAALPSDDLRQRDARELLDLALHRLSPQQRVAFHLVAVEGYSLAEAAELYGMSVTSFKRLYYSVKENVTATLRRHGLNI